MKLKSEDILKNGYDLFAQLDHSEIAVFIQPYLFRKNMPSVFYWLFNVFLLVISIIKIFTCSIGIEASFGYFAIGFCGLLPLIPIHELIHGLFYKLDGAPSVQYKANFKKFIFYAMADNYVVNYFSFVKLALAPFVIINSVLILAIIFTSGSLSFIFAGMLFVHTSGCAGDFALTSYFVENGKNNLITYDNIKEGKSYFYKKTNN
ncbi:MAG: DUF3267 domain-containing protein [Bacteroidota bacterium]